MNPWSPMFPTCPGRERELGTLTQFLRHGRVVGIAGQPGAGRSHLAGALASTFEGSGVMVSAAGCETEADIVRALGDALGVFPCGDEALVRSAVGQRWLVVDDVSHSAASAVLALGFDGVVVLVGEIGPDVPTVELGPLADGRWPLQHRLAEALGVPLAGLVETLAPLRPLSGLPMGLGIRVDLPFANMVLREDPRDRRLLRSGVAHLLGGSASEGAAWVRDVLIARPQRTEALEGAAFGSPVEGMPDPRDILLLRLLAEHPAERGDALSASCVALAARLLLRCGQIGEAGRLLTTVAPSAPEDVGLLTWVGGDVLLATGELRAARAAWQRAAEGVGRDPFRAIRLRLASAEQLALRGHNAVAAELIVQARGLSRGAGDLAGSSASWRASAALATSAGEGLGAAQFLAEAAAEDVGLVGISVQLLAGDHAGAQAALEAMTVDAPLLRGNLMRRRADLLLRDGATGRAGRAAREAASLYASVGEHISAAGALSVAADALALEGGLEAAARLYGAVIGLQVRLQDLCGLDRSLAKAALIDVARGVPASADLREQQRAALRQCWRSGVGD